MIYSNLWRYCVSTREYPAKFIKPRPRRPRAKRVSSKKQSPLKRAFSSLSPLSLEISLTTISGAPLLPPEKLEPEYNYKEPFSEPYFENFTKRKRRTGIFKHRRPTRWSREQPECHTKLSKLPTYKKGHFHLVQDGYIDFINSAYGTGSLLLTRWDVENAWVGLVRAKFDEWYLEKRLKERMLKALGKALSKVLPLELILSEMEVANMRYRSILLDPESVSTGGEGYRSAEHLQIYT
jgi:hypothetical protein